jgi:transposase-like protein
MAKHSTEFKLEVVKYRIDGKHGSVATSKFFGIDDSTVRKWVDAYKLHGLLGLKKPYSHYPIEFKLKVLRAISSGELSVRKACAQFNIPNHGRILIWQRLYNEGGIDALTNRPQGRPKRMSTPTKPYQPSNKPVEELTPEELILEVQYRRAEVAYLKKLDALIQAKKSAPKTKR